MSVVPSPTPPPPESPPPATQRRLPAYRLSPPRDTALTTATLPVARTSVAATFYRHSLLSRRRLPHHCRSPSCRLLCRIRRSISRTSHSTSRPRSPPFIEVPSVPQRLFRTPSSSSLSTDCSLLPRCANTLSSASSAASFGHRNIAAACPSSDQPPLTALHLHLPLHLHDSSDPTSAHLMHKKFAPQQTYIHANPEDYRPHPPQPPPFRAIVSRRHRSLVDPPHHHTLFRVRYRNHLHTQLTSSPSLHRPALLLSIHLVQLLVVYTTTTPAASPPYPTIRCRSPASPASKAASSAAVDRDSRNHPLHLPHPSSGLTHRRCFVGRPPPQVSIAATSPALPLRPASPALIVAQPGAASHAHYRSPREADAHRHLQPTETRPCSVELVSLPCEKNPI